MIQGTTIELFKAETSRQHTIKISTDTSGTQSEVEAFVNAFNKVNQKIDELIKSATNDPKGLYDFIKTATTQAKKLELANLRKEGGPLLGNVTVLGLQALLRNDLTLRVYQPDFQSLSDIGVTSDFKTGNLKIDKVTLANAIGSNVDRVANLFSDATNGVATKLYTDVNSYIKGGRVITLETEKLENDLRQIKRDKYELDLKVKRREIELTMRFSSLDVLIGRMKNESEAVGRQLQKGVEPMSFKKG